MLSSWDIWIRDMYIFMKETYLSTFEAGNRVSNSQLQMTKNRSFWKKYQDANRKDLYNN